jgi:hypothetical protein
MYRLWFEADYDMLSSPGYSLRFTGQGIHRLQGAASVSRTMHTILYTAQKEFGSWIGSSAIHLGDTNVPNALVFIDKYAQLERILAPIDRTLREVEAAVASGHVYLKPWFEKYYDGKNFNFPGEPDPTVTDPAEFKRAQKAAQLSTVTVRVMVDFFRYAFDGSGADDYFSAGSCIDGRLTSAWNWCSKIASKSYYMAFLATGFTGFDG